MTLSTNQPQTCLSSPSGALAITTADGNGNGKIGDSVSVITIVFASKSL